jgi:hypothetical protein
LKLLKEFIKLEMSNSIHNKLETFKSE